MEEGAPERNLRWWGSTELSRDQWCTWHIGQLSFFVRCADTEWHLAWTRGSDPLAPTLSCNLDGDVSPDVDAMEQARFAFSGASRTLTLAPQLADRPVIVRPEIPLYIAPGQHVVLYVSTAIWLLPQVEGVTLVEIPITRPSDTWFGANTRFGELCYGSITRARTSNRNYEPLPHRAVTPVDIHNEGAAALRVEQIRVPVTSLALYANDQGHLTTDSVRLVRREGESEATLDIPDASISDGAQRIAEPRFPLASGTIVQAFAELFD